MQTGNYQKLARPPEWALRTIQGGRLKGKTDINPQWRYEVMDEVFGACGFGWKYEIENLWTEPGANGEITAHAIVRVYVKKDNDWSSPIPGVGGSMLVTKEKTGLNTSDEAFKMAVTDALSVALKYLGVAADIYKNLWDGSKYKELPKEPDLITKEQIKILEELNTDMANLVKACKVTDISQITSEQAEAAILRKRNQLVKEDYEKRIEEEAQKVGKHD